MEEREHLSKTLARTRGDKERTLHWLGIVYGKIAAESSQKTQYPPQFTFRIRNHCKSSVNRQSQQLWRRLTYAAHAMSPVVNVAFFKKDYSGHVNCVFVFEDKVHASPQIRLR